MRFFRTFAAVPVTAVTIAAALFASPFVPGAAADDSVVPPPPSADAVEQLVHEHLDASGVAGVTVTIVREGEVVHAEGYGQDSEGADVAATTPMRVASFAKSMTAASVLGLVEEGRVGLDDPVREHLPDYQPVDERAEDITVRQLLNQTSGLGSNGLASSHRKEIESAEEAVDILSGMESIDEPGARHNYFNGNYWLLAALVMEITGMERHEHIAEHVFEPLGMDDSAVFSDPGQGLRGNAAAGHAGLLGTAITHPGEDVFTIGDGDVLTTAEDMGRWLAPFTNEGRTVEGEPYLTEESIDASLTASAPEGVYAFGWRDRTDPEDGRPRVNHGGTGVDHVAHQGIYLERQYAVAVMSNTMTMPYEITGPLADAVMDLVDGSDPEPPTRVNLYLDLALLGLVLLSVGLGVCRWRRAPEWAERYRSLPRWRTVLALGPRLLPASVFIGFLLLITIMGAYPGSVWMWFFWPMLGLWVVAVGLVQASTVLVRLWHLRRTRTAVAHPVGVEEQDTGGKPVHPV